MHLSIIFSFGEVVRVSNSEGDYVDGILLFEDNVMVDIVTLDMIKRQEHIKPKHVFKDFVKKKQIPYLIVTKEKLKDFLLSIDYIDHIEEMGLRLT